MKREVLQHKPRGLRQRGNDDLYKKLRNNGTNRQLKKWNY
jgi:hypothetical protein